MGHIQLTFDPCCICKEGPGRFMVCKDGEVYYLCGGCFIRREDHLRITGEDLLRKKAGDTQSGPAPTA